MTAPENNKSQLILTVVNETFFYKKKKQAIKRSKMHGKARYTCISMPVQIIIIKACLDHVCINSRLCSLKNHYIIDSKANVPAFFVVLILRKQIAY